MPQDPETGEIFGSAEEALAAALPEGVDAGAVLDNLAESGYTLEPSGGESVGIAMGIEEAPEGEEAMLEGELPLEEELAPGGAPPLEEEALAISGGPIGEEEPTAKRRDRVAEGLMEQFKTGMV